MNIKKIIRLIWQVSIPKTLRFNLHYFGIKNGLKLPAIVSKNFKLLSLNGVVLLEEYKLGSLILGFAGVGIFDHKYDRGIWQNSGKIILHGRCSFGQGSKVSNGGVLEIGKNFSNTANGAIVCWKKITIGDNVLTSWDTLIMDSDMHTIYYNHDKNNWNIDEEIRIGNHVWIGCRSLLLKGTVISDDSVIAANSTISKKFETPGLLIGGINKILKEDIEWDSKYKRTT